jgi:hypothetical protein
MQNTTNLKLALHQLVIETYDDQLLSKVQTYFEDLKSEKIENRKRQLALKQMIAAQDGEQLLDFAKV